MNKRSYLLGVATLAGSMFLAGCNSFQSRAQEKSAVFDTLSSSTQQRLERGVIRVGDTEDLVYIALGYPDETREVTTADGTQPLWIYRTYWQQYEGTAWAGWRRLIVPAANGRGYVVFHEPVTRDIYRTRVDEVIRVTFANNVVSSVEQRRR